MITGNPGDMPRPAGRRGRERPAWRSHVARASPRLVTAAPRQDPGHDEHRAGPASIGGQQQRQDGRQ